MELSEIKEQFNYEGKFATLRRRLKKNALLSYYYDVFAEDLRFDALPPEIYTSDFFKGDFWERRKEDLHERGKRVALCCKFWSCDYYRLQGVVDLQSVNLCKDRFCDNCQNAISKQRSDKYTPVLLKLSEDYDIYHVVLTVPNCALSDLVGTLNKMFQCYKRLCQYLDGRKGVRNVDYMQIGYKGSIRALEITKNKETGLFHPHFHCLWLCDKGGNFDKNRKNINIYSYKKNNSHIRKSHSRTEKPQRYFSDFEILLQKTWKLLYDGIEVNCKNLDGLPLGYSCMLENAQGRYKEVFKYATKGLLSSEEEKNPVQNYTDFVLLFLTLYRRRLVQGYGCLYRLKFEEKIDLSVDDLYLQIISYLHKIENPEKFYTDLDFLSEDIGKNKNITYISRKSIMTLGVEYEE